MNAREALNSAVDALEKMGFVIIPRSEVEAKEAGCTLDDLVWAASALARRDKDVERRLRLWMADCAAHVLHLYERYGTSEAPRNAIIAHRKFARGEIDAAARAAARAAAWDAEDAAARAAARAAAWDAEEAWQLDRLVAWMSDDEPVDWPLPARAALKEASDERA